MPAVLPEAPVMHGRVVMQEVVVETQMQVAGERVATRKTGPRTYDSPGEEGDVSFDGDRMFVYAGNAWRKQELATLPDTSPPVLTLLGAPTVTIARGATYVDAGVAVDDSPSTINVPAVMTSTVDINLVGTYTVTYTATDGAGNVGTPAVRTVVVEDTAPPIIVMLGDAHVTIERLDAYVDAGALALEPLGASAPVFASTAVVANASVVSATAPSNPSFPASGLFASPVVAYETSALSPIAVVVDLGVPVLVERVEIDGAGVSTPSSFTVAFAHFPQGPFADSMSSGTLTGGGTHGVDVSVAARYVRVTVPTNQSGDGSGVTRIDAIRFVGRSLTNGEFVGVTATGSVDTAVPGVYTIAYNAIDLASNAATAVVRTISVQDTISPVVTLVGQSAVSLSTGDVWTDPGATASDQAGAEDLTSSIVVAGQAVDTVTAGTYVVTYTVTDIAGRSASVSRTITVTPQFTTAIVDVSAGALEPYPPFVPALGDHAVVGPSVTNATNIFLNKSLSFIHFEEATGLTTLPGYGPISTTTYLQQKYTALPPALTSMGWIALQSKAYGVLSVPATVRSITFEAFRGGLFEHIIFESDGKPDVVHGGPIFFLNNTLRTIRLADHISQVNMTGAKTLQRLTVTRSGGTLLTNVPAELGFSATYISPNIAPPGLYVKTATGVVYEPMSGTVPRFVDTVNGTVVNYGQAVLDADTQGILCIPSGMTTLTQTNCGVTDTSKLSTFTGLRDIDYSCATSLTSIGPLWAPYTVTDACPTALLLPASLTSMPGSVNANTVYTDAVCIVPASLGSMFMSNALGVKYAYFKGTGTARFQVNTENAAYSVDYGYRVADLRAHSTRGTIGTIIARAGMVATEFSALPWFMLDPLDPYRYGPFPLTLPAGVYTRTSENRCVFTPWPKF